MNRILQEIPSPCQIRSELEGPVMWKLFTVAPFSPRARDRGLTGVLVSLIRLLGEEFNKNTDASGVTREHPIIQTAIEAISQRASLVEGSNERADSSASALSGCL